MNEGIKIGHIVSDESGRRYQLITVCEHERTHEKLLIYQQLFGEFKVLARTMESTFQSAEAAGAQAPAPTPEQIPTPEPAPSARVQASEPSPAPPAPKAKPRAQKTVTDLMMDFFDERDLAQKQKILDEMAFRPDMSDNIIDNMAAALDIVIDEGPIDQRFAELRSCIRTRAQYELKRY